MGLFKKRYSKNIARDNEFLKEYAIKCNGLLFYVEGKEQVKKELIQLKDDFQYTVGSTDAAAKPLERKIEKDYNTLTKLLQQLEWDEGEALLLIRGIRRYIVEISSLR
ncbi:MAG: hypothetical protein IKA62_03460 [Clostridia bacterium]|nr:hypothetical protein [Clostridia bacterium]